MRHTSLILALIAVVTTLTDAQPASPPPPTTSSTTPSPTPTAGGTGTSDPPAPNFPLQTFESTACSQCTFASIPNEPSCAALVPVDMQQIQASFTPTSVNLNALFTAVNGNPAIKNCACHWATGTFNQTTSGAAASCLTTSPNVSGPILAALKGAGAGGVAPCNATQAAQAEEKFGMLSAMIHCDAVVSHSTGRPKDKEPAPASSAATERAMRWSGIGLVVSVGAAVLAVVTVL